MLKSHGWSPDVLGRGRPGTVPGCILQALPELNPSDVPQPAGLFLRMEPSGKHFVAVFPTYFVLLLRL